MNKLAKNTNKHVDNGLSGRKLLFNTALLLFATLLVHSAVALYYSPWYRAVIMASRKTPAIVELAGESVGNKIDSLRRQLAFMARQPVLRNVQLTDDIENTLVRVREVLARLASLSEPLVGLAYGELRSQYRNMIYLTEFPRAFLLSILFDTGLFGTKDQFVELFDTSKDYLATDEKMLSEVNVARNFIAVFNELVDTGFGRLRSITAFYSQFTTSKSRVPADEAGARNFLVAALTDFSDFRALSFKSFDGTTRTQAYNIDPELFDSENGDVRAISSNVPFYSGAVLSQEDGNSPLWQIAVPIRNHNREPVACLSAVVDLSFLQPFTQIVSGQSDQKLMIIDSSGQYITGAESIAAAQLRDEIAVAAKNADSSGFFRLSDYDKNETFIAAKPIASDEYRFLPSWTVAVCGSLAQYGASADKGLLIAVILLAALGGYALFYSIPGFFKLVVKEQE